MYFLYELWYLYSKALVSRREENFIIYKISTAQYPLHIKIIKFCLKLTNFTKLITDI